MPADIVRTRFLIGLSAALLLLFLGTATQLQAASHTITVTNTANSGAGSLRQAILAANGSGGPSVIDFDAAVTGTITLASSLPSITGDLDIVGPGETVLSVSGNDVPGIRPFTISAGSTTTISGLTVEKGNWGRYGGGIKNAGTLTVTNSTVRDNFGRAGGGIYSSGTLAVTNSTIINNSAQHGGGIGSFVGSVSITNSTVSGNTALTRGGGMVVNVELTLIDSTVSGNTVSHLYGHSGGGLEVWGAATLINSTISGNTAPRGSGMRGNGTVTLINSHIDNNLGPIGGSGVYFLTGTLTLDESSTISGHVSVGIRHLGFLGPMILTGGTVSENWSGIDNGPGATLTVIDTAVIDNVWWGIFNSQGSRKSSSLLIPSMLTLNRVAVSGNGRSGIHNRSELTLNNSTVSGNTGHGIFNVRVCRSGDSVCIEQLDLKVSSSTVSDNGGSGISSSPAGSNDPVPLGAAGRVELRNTIVAGNGVFDCAFPTTIFSFGHNLDSDGTCSLVAGADQPATPPQLGPLQDNGGPTDTHALLSGSPAIDAGICINPTDQRGIGRPQPTGGSCDIGAYEFEFGAGPVVTLVGPSGADEGDTRSYSFTTVDPGGAPFSLVDQDCGSNGFISNENFTPTTGAGSFDCTFPIGPDSSDVSVQVADKYSAPSKVDMITVTISVPVTNFAPVVFLDGPSDADAGETRSYSFTAFEPDGDTFILVDQGCGSNGVLSASIFDPGTGAGSFDCTFPYGPATSDVSVQLADSHSLSSNLDIITVTVTVPVSNVAPVVTLDGPGEANEGETGSYSFTTVDPGEDEFTLVSQTCGSAGVLSAAMFDALSGAGSFDCTFPDGPDTSDVSVQVADSENASSNVGIITVTVDNVAPTVVLSGPVRADEGDTKHYTYESSDPGDDTFTRLDQSCGTAGILSNDDFTPATGAGSFDCTFPYGPAASDVSVQLADSDFASSAVDTITVTIDNVAPTVEPVIVPTYPVNINDPVIVSADFSDPAGTGDATYTCTVDYGDGTLSGTVAGTSCTAVIDAAPGIYTVTITVTDKDGGTGSATATTSIVVYDPAAGFVTGGGWIDSPAGADFADLEASGKATFGFVAKYKKRATTPSGNTQFQFKAGRLNFHVDSYQWLVVGDGLARFKGTGTIKGEGSFDFLITVTDGALDGGGPDQFRIQIFGRYDSGVDRELSKGSIVIHAK